MSRRGACGSPANGSWPARSSGAPASGRRRPSSWLCRIRSVGPRHRGARPFRARPAGRVRHRRPRALQGPRRQPLPGLAQVANQQGKHLGRAFARKPSPGAPLPVFQFHDRGNTAIIGRNRPSRFRAPPAQGFRRLGALGDRPHLSALGFEKRLLVTLEWLWLYVTYQRGARLITGERKAPIQENHQRRSAAECTRSPPLPLTV